MNFEDFHNLPEKELEPIIRRAVEYSNAEQRKIVEKYEQKYGKS